MRVKMKTKCRLPTCEKTWDSEEEHYNKRYCYWRCGQLYNKIKEKIIAGDRISLEKKKDDVFMDNYKAMKKRYEENGKL